MLREKNNYTFSKHTELKSKHIKWKCFEKMRRAKLDAIDVSSIYYS